MQTACPACPRLSGNGRGPAAALLPEGDQKYFMSWRGMCLLVAGSRMKLASLDETADQKLRIREAEAHAEKGFVDLSKDAAPILDESEGDFAPHGPQAQVRRRRDGLERSVREARDDEGLEECEAHAQVTFNSRPLRTR